MQRLQSVVIRNQVSVRTVNKVRKQYTPDKGIKANLKMLAVDTRQVFLRKQ